MSKILPTVNPCFPRSGHRFLRSICKQYFGRDMVFRSVHMRKDRGIENANYIKDHDFGLLHDRPDIPITPDMQYLVQYRHPLESLQSYFEFQVHHGHIPDTAESWETFLPKALAYWQAFVTKWCLDPEQRLTDRAVMRVQYADLYAEPLETVRQVVLFLTAGQAAVDEPRLSRAVEQFTNGFARYSEGQSTGAMVERKPRDIRDFRYFNDAVLSELEESLTAQFLTPLKLSRRLAQPAA